MPALTKKRTCRDEYLMNFQEQNEQVMIYKQENDIGEGEVEIIGLLRKGNEKGLELLFRRHQAALINFALGYVKDYHAAEDIVAENFISLWQKRNDFNKLTAIKAFLYISVKNACLNLLKQNGRRSKSHKEIKYLTEESEDFFSASMIKAELLELLWQDAENLPPVRFQIFKLFFVEGLTSFEIARALKISVDTVRVQKARALNQLREFVKRNYDKWFFLILIHFLNAKSSMQSI
jgi:RNA polymerase sigma-70 factor (ECF subfamily)